MSKLLLPDVDWFTPLALVKKTFVLSGRVFEREPGVRIIEHTKNTARRRYRTRWIPESVALRVHQPLASRGKS